METAFFMPKNHRMRPPELGRTSEVVGFEDAQRGVLMHTYFKRKGFRLVSQCFFSGSMFSGLLQEKN